MKNYHYILTAAKCKEDAVKFTKTYVDNLIEEKDNINYLSYYSIDDVFDLEEDIYEASDKICEIEKIINDEIEDTREELIIYKNSADEYIDFYKHKRLIDNAIDSGRYLKTGFSVRDIGISEPGYFQNKILFYGFTTFLNTTVRNLSRSHNLSKYGYKNFIIGLFVKS